MSRERRSPAAAGVNSVGRPSPPGRIETEVCILGAGPHGLAAAVHLRRARPDLHLVAVDPAGAWMAGWHEQFARAEIESLRSPIVHHPAPDPFELSDYIAQRRLRRSGLAYDQPTTAVFAAFCDDLTAAAGLADPLATSADTVRCEGGRVLVATGQGEIRADHLVVATNPHRRSVPDWAGPLLGRRADLCTYGSDVDLRTATDLQDRRVVIVGGGLTAAHLAIGAATRGADVHLVTRRALETRDFDTDPGWLGPRFLTDYGRDRDPVSRLRSARAARGGGTVPPWMRTRLDAVVADGRLHLHEGVEVRAADVGPDGRAVLVLDERTMLRADQVWLATGTTTDIGLAHCLAGLSADADLHAGLPLTDTSLRLGSQPVHVMGRLATLTLGPAAGNLWGAQRAATRITEAITGVNLEHESVVPVPPPPPARETDQS